MNIDKRLVFTVSPGRSGTNYLTHLLTGLPGIRAEHEPVPNYRHYLPRARYDATLARRFLLKEKLPAIAAVEEPVYIETSHYMAKGFFDRILDLGITPDLILLKRDPRKVASSWVLMGGGMRELRAGKNYQHLLGPQEPNFLPAKNYEQWNDYQLCYWYALENFFRMQHYAAIIRARGGKVFETSLEALKGDDYARLLQWLEVPQDIIETRVNDKEYREQPINLQTEYKARWNLEKKLASLDLPPLEEQVLQDVGLTRAQVEEMLQAPVEGEKKTPSTIFVCIASYRDRECQWTVKDLFDKAAHPERVNVGICWQYDAEADKECFAIEPPRPAQVRVIQYHYKDSKGANWARAQAMGLRQGEDYVLVIDSHMRFEPGWDELLLAALKRCPSEKPVLTAWSPGYTPPNKLEADTGKIERLRIHSFEWKHEAQFINLNRRYEPIAQVKGRMDPACSCVANCIFAPAAAFAEAPFDPHIDFWGDEINLSARLWTHGWDFFQIDRRVMYHYWDPQHMKDRETYRDRKNPRHQRARTRNLHLFGIELSKDAQALAELDKYRLGTARRIEDYWRFMGIDFASGSIQPHALRGEWVMAGEEKEEKKFHPLTSNFLPPATRHPLPATIFVNVASYRDPECQWTLKDLFAKAAYPDRIHIGICLQIDPVEDAACMPQTDRPNQLRVQQCDWRDSKGANWARAQAQALYNGEDYVLQIDSHMRFTHAWDETLIHMLNRCPSAKPVISAYLPNYQPPDVRPDHGGQLLRMCVRRFGDENDPQLLHLTAVFAGKDSERAGLYPSPFYIANFMFARAATLHEVPIDPHIHFYGDEISYTARLWTHGYNIFQPDSVVAYHYWARKDQLHRHPYRKNKNAESKRSYERVRHLLALERTDNAQALVDMERYGLGKARPLSGLWTFAGVDWAAGTISKDALEGRWNVAGGGWRVAGEEKEEKKLDLLAPHHQPPATRHPPHSTIFVNIASYRDRECQWTVKDLFDKATYPDRIHVGICWQFDAQEDEDCFLISTRPEQVSILPVDWREGEGVCWARWQAQQLYNGEDYNLQTDAHMRFVPGWDELMIEELAACESPKAMITCTMGIYTPPNELEKDPKPTIRRVRQFQPDGNIRGQGDYLDSVPEKPLNGAFVAGGFLFSRGEVVREVPYDPYLYFDQEEITYAARLYTHGWDVFYSRRAFMYHYYNKSSGDSVRPLHWKDLHKEDHKRIAHLQARGLNRFNHMTGFKLSDDPQVIKELDIYGWGTVRSFAQFEEYCGIDFKKKFASEKAMRGLFIRDLNKYTKGIYIPELDANKTAAATLAPGQLKMLEKGDFVPMFEAMDTAGVMRSIEMYGGQHCMLFFLPSGNPDYVRQFFNTLGQKFGEAKHRNIWQIFILDNTVEELLALKKNISASHTLWADPELKLAQAFGICKAGDKAVPPVGYVLNNNLRISRVRFNLSADKLAAAIVADGQAEVAAYKARHYERRIVSQTAPALIIPDAFTPELCKKCIDAFHNGHRFDGTVGAEAKAAYRPNTKVRTDHIISGPLLDEIDEKFSRSVFPEIKKIFGFEVKYREIYKVGLYKGEKGGFFKMHRDNFETPLSYRRVAMTLQLNDDYEGGGLRFPEYDENIYRPMAGGAIAFSCATMHEARPVISGERYILVCFFHGEEEEAFRRYYLTHKGEKNLKIKDYVAKLRPEPAVKQSRDFWKEWWRKRVGGE